MKAGSSITIRYVDNHLLVVEKPPGMLSQADRTGDEDMLTACKEWVGKEFNKPGNVYLGLVHRLDRPASGLMVFARTSKAASRLAEQFRSRSVTKKYVALVEGNAPFNEKWIDWLVKENERVRIVRESHQGAKRAELSMQTLAAEGKKSLISIELHTGRPHQIRVQCASRKCPIVGDFKYGATTELDGRNLALHASILELDHPTTKERMRWTARPPGNWPQEWADRVPV
ncbi:MAG: RNA pseudouridine synthase [Bacteroidetes bacterium]|nr:RNA pseudouridine synthase [Bacteroidota bacterium]